MAGSKHKMFGLLRPGRHKVLRLWARMDVSMKVAIQLMSEAVGKPTVRIMEATIGLIV